MNILVTGGQGFLGRHIVNQLIDEGHTVINYSRDMRLPFENSKNIFVFGELYDIPRLMNVMKEHKVDRIIHTAGQSNPEVSSIVPYATAEANVMGTVALLEAARLVGIKRIVLYSSEVAYGDLKAELIPLETELLPTTPYAVTKVATEMFGRAYNNTFGLDCVSIRLGLVYGSGRVMQEKVRDAVQSAFKGETFKLERGRDHKLPLIHVKDAANFSVKACFAEKINERAVYNATNEEIPSYGEVLDILKTLIPEAKFEVGDGDFGTGLNGRLDLSESKKDLGYKQKIDLKEGLAEYVDWLKKQNI